MGSSQDTEITLGTGKLLFLFFGLVGVCALFFALGYSLGRKSDLGLAGASNAGTPKVSTSVNKSGGGAAASPQMTFSKNVEQKDANAELNPAAEAKPDTTPPAVSPDKSGQSNGVDPATTVPTAGYFVQVAAVSKQEDADSLVDALKKKEYPAFVASTAANDKLFHVQLGPYSDVKDAEGMRTKLIGDGYNPILKK
ncbi:MAG TPA: SPOR domain-containing protein [Candidatus Sulfotelmatobacter sp.]